MNSRKEIVNLFPQPIFRYKVDNFKSYNKELEEYIYKLREEDEEGIIRSNRGGWHSKPFAIREKRIIEIHL